ncbi:hypothetical protein [Bradyrhizobium sp. 2TAF24]|uniref:hypothetical protein n=1 Tax=Bradyrhizobium sp. 2TAF24 TaxID=3233011 RepID=UPI003F8E254C
MVEIINIAKNCRNAAAARLAQAMRSDAVVGCMGWLLIAGFGGIGAILPHMP